MTAAGMNPALQPETGRTGVHASQQNGGLEQQALSPVQPTAPTSPAPMPALQSGPPHSCVDSLEITPAPLSEPNADSRGARSGQAWGPPSTGSMAAGARRLHASRAQPILDSAQDHDRVGSRVPIQALQPSQPIHMDHIAQVAHDKPPSQPPQNDTSLPDPADGSNSKYGEGSEYGDGTDPALPARQEVASADCDQESMGMASALSEPCAYWAAQTGVPEDEAAASPSSHSAAPGIYIHCFC